MNSSELTLLSSSSSCSLYAIGERRQTSVRALLASTPESRAVCNNAALVGVEYTEALKAASAAVLRELLQVYPSILIEEHSVVLHILRGGLNFGLREALYSAAGWNRHAAAFISAQRVRSESDPEQWEIQENGYEKVDLPPVVDLLLGDVVVTGTSFRFALQRLREHVQRSGSVLRSVLCFTIGGSRAVDALLELDEFCRAAFPEYAGCTAVYFEGRFAVAAPETPLQIKLTGTDLLRRDALLAPEFLESQYEDPAYPLERCAIYDAGSRAFWLPEYRADVLDYWQQTLALAEEGLTYAGLLAERFPELAPRGLTGADLRSVCRKQIETFLL